jgi:hypothetical protein
MLHRMEVADTDVSRIKPNGLNVCIFLTTEVGMNFPHFGQIFLDGTVPIVPKGVWGPTSLDWILK